jgi:DNA-binding transcriptional MerR regulator
VYSRRDVENLMRVRELLYREGFTIAGAKKKLQRSGLEPSEAAESTAEDASKIREQLVAMRVEIEAFLVELGPGRR